MKYFTTIIFFLLSFTCYSQSWEGKWKGNYSFYYSSRSISNYYPIELEFVPTSDTSYSVYCHTSIHSVSVITKADYELIGKDSIYLSESEIIAPKEPSSIPIILTRMYLRIRNKKNKIILEGIWENQNDNDSRNSGRIYFWRRKQKK